MRGRWRSTKKDQVRARRRTQVDDHLNEQRPILFVPFQVLPTINIMSDSETSVVVVPDVQSGIVGVTATATKTTSPREHDKSDPYQYQLGFGNYVSTEAVYVTSFNELGTC